MNTASADIIGLLPDPEFELIPTGIVNGTSDEFSVIAPEGVGSDLSYIDLRWEHTAGTLMTKGHIKILMGHFITGIQLLM